MQTGKLPAEVLRRLLARTRLGPDVIIGPSYGEDAAAVRFEGNILVAASDPITFATDRIGYYAVSVNANDIAAHGAVPRWFLATLMLPEGSSESDAEDVFDQIESACAAMDVSLIGGHTEVTSAVDRIVICGTMLGEADAESLVSTGGARVGDALILAGGVAIEGTSILAREASDDLARRGVAAGTIQAAARLLDSPGICVAPYARAAMQAGGVTSMHDPTEGGLATGLRELAGAANCGLTLHRQAVRSAILDECRAVCDALGLDPLGLIASGSLIITASQESAPAIQDSVARNGVPCRVLGQMTAPGTGLRYDDGAELPRFDRDEIARYFQQRNLRGRVL